MGIAITDIASSYAAAPVASVSGHVGADYRPSHHASLTPPKPFSQMTDAEYAAWYYSTETQRAARKSAAERRQYTRRLERIEQLEPATRERLKARRAWHRERRLRAAGVES